MKTISKIRYTESQRAELRAQVKVAADIIAPFWPLRTAIAINPLVGLEHLDFHEAIRHAQPFWGGRGYLPNEWYRDAHRQGRIRPEHIDAELRPLATEQSVTLGGQPLSHLEVLRTHLLHGITAPAGETLDALFEQAPEKTVLETLTNRLKEGFPSPKGEAPMQDRVWADRAALGRHVTLAQWCDRTLGTDLWPKINTELIRWCAAFVDEGQAAWAMPAREQGFYGAWKQLVRYDGSVALMGIPDWRERLADLPDRPEDAVLDSLAALGLPDTIWPDYFSLHLAALPGWAGHIKWRAEQPDPVSAEWIKAYPVDLVQYMAVRLWYEQGLVRRTCGHELGFEGTYGALTAFMQRQPEAYFLRQERVAGALSSDCARQVDRLHHRSSRCEEDAWRSLAMRYVKERAATHGRRATQTAAWQLVHLASALARDPATLTAAQPSELRTVLGWVEAFPESQHGPVWLEALEAGYHASLLGQLKANIATIKEPVPEIRPQGQAVFCIDVRSEVFRRHLEDMGDYETFGFAGFFICFIRFRAFDRHHDVNNFPVIMKARNEVREIPRSAEGLVVQKYKARRRIVHTGHLLFHDLKENVITPYVMVESLGWLFSLPFVGKMLAPAAYRRVSAGLTRLLAPPVATTLTVDKLSRNEVEEMLVADQRALIRHALREHFGLHDAKISSELIEALRRRALEEADATTPVRVPGLSEKQEPDLMAVLRQEYRISRRGAVSRMDRITQTGLTLDEQVFTVGFALRMMGLTRNFGRLVALIGHGSTVENNPYESALECGACGGNDGKANVRLIAAMANKPAVRERIKKDGLCIPDDTHFIGGQVDTCTDEVKLFDLEDVPPTHSKDLIRFQESLREAERQTGRERLARLPDVGGTVPVTKVQDLVLHRSADWSQIRPEWALAGNAAIIVGRRLLSRGVKLDGRVFLHSYDWMEDPDLKALEIILTAPGQVMEWINLGYYFSTVDNAVFGAGNKIYHNVVGRVGVMLGTQSDLRIGLGWQSVMDGEEPYHEPMRLLLIVEAPRPRIETLIQRHPILQRFYHNRWVHLVALERDEGVFYRYHPDRRWEKINVEC